MIFRIKEIEVKTGSINNVKCKLCNESTTIYYTTIIKYVSLYFIPTFPYKKITEFICDNCDSYIKYDDLSIEIQNKWQRINENEPAKRPLWTFSGLFLFVFILIWAIFQSIRAENNYQMYFNKPLVGDIYFTNFNTSEYSTMKIINVSKDKIEFVVSDSIASKYLKNTQLDNVKYYSNKFKTIEVKQLKKLLDDRKIYRIDRAEK
jgi:hypothetical protein